MPIPIRPAEGISNGQIINQWTNLIDQSAQEHFGGRFSVARTEGRYETVIFLREGDQQRAEISVSISPSQPNDLSIRTLPARGESRDTGAAMLAGGIIAVIGWIVFLVWFWDIFWDIEGVRGKVFWVLIIMLAGIFSAAGLAAAGDYLATRWFALLDKPRQKRSEQFVESEIRPWMQSVIDRVWWAAQEDAILARRYGLDFSRQEEATQPAAGSS